MEFTSAWVDSNEQIKMVRKTLPKPKANEVVVRIKACGICGTDIHFVKDLPAGTLTPLGHEVAGYIHEVGSPFPDLNVGDSVVVENNIACGRCEQCLNQKPQACENIYSYMDDQAGMGQFLVVPREMVIPYEGLDYPEATLAEPITVALDLSREAAIELFDDVLIMGPGIIGLSCIKLAKLRGARNVVMVGHHLDTPRGAYRGEVARKLGTRLDRKHTGLLSPSLLSCCNHVIYESKHCQHIWCSGHHCRLSAEPDDRWSSGRRNRSRVYRGLPRYWNSWSLHPA